MSESVILDRLHELSLGLNAHTVAIIAVALVAVAVVHYARYAKGKIHLPGPTPLPIVGNLLHLGKDPAMTYHEWSKTYGDVFKITLGEREVVVVNSAKAAKDLFLDQGSVYISRPMFHNFHKVISSSAGFTIGTSPWDESCKRKRRAAATALNKVAVQTYVPIIDRETLALIEDLYTGSEAGKVQINPFAYVQRLALNVSLVANYGCRLDGVGDDMLREIVDVETNVANFRSVNNSWRDYIPLLRLVPSSAGAAEAKLMAETRVRRDKYMNFLLDDLKDRVKAGKDIPCITGNILKDPEAKLTDEELSSICLSMVSAGLDTLANTLFWSIGYLAKHPEIQERAYQAIYDVYQGAIPDSNEETVEYITALGKECSRYFSVLKLALPRATLGDSEYRGVHIPDGTTVFLNAWGIHHDEERYGDVENFRVERFLDESEASRQAHYSYGAGRRMCAGVHLANREMYIAFCKLIYFFKIEMGDKDYDIDPATACANPLGLASTPHPFKVRFVPRDASTIEGWIEDEKSRAELKLAKSIGMKA
ncbi:Phenylacetate 2-hydroxylase [Vanrija pseudolonga]|uniref:Phenylacetate 2-hydroxylase n=1 Tax=Vanrija pseudolonga TaxID=143232 RepID=A0AAF0Y0Z5_9TREE|nr:Phenylacetate 2-hydroxylase [Vanrija pseudolonga]